MVVEWIGEVSDPERQIAVRHHIAEIGTVQYHRLREFEQHIVKLPNVVNGVLENLFVPGLDPGNYRLRLAIVDNTGGFLQTPFEVPFAVVR